MPDREEVLRLAREAGIDEFTGWRDDDTVSKYYEAWPEQLERFAALVAESCAKIVEETDVEQFTYCMVLHDDGQRTLNNAASAIRSRFGRG